MSAEPSNKCAINFDLNQKPMLKDEGRGRRISNKGEDLYVGGSPVSHVIQWELAGGPQVIFPPSQPAPAPRLRDNGPCPRFLLDPSVFITTLKFCTHSMLFAERPHRTGLDVIHRGSGNDL